MRFQFSDITSYKGSGSEQNQVKADGSNHTAKASPMTTGPGAVKLVPGSTISGQVISVEGETICLKLTGDIEITAKLENSMEIAVGQRLTFDVKSIGTGQLSLRPLFANTAVSSTMTNGLTAGNIPITETSISMIAEMMNKGMSIDKNSLQTMYRHIMNFPEARPADIVEMSALRIPITANNMTQFEAYKNFEGQITNSILALTDHLQETCQALINSGNEEQAVSVYKQVIEMLMKDSPLTEGALVKNNTLQEAGTMPQGQSSFVNGESAENIILPKTGKEASQNILLTGTEAREPHTNHIIEHTVNPPKESILIENDTTPHQPQQSGNQLAMANYISESNRIIIADLLTQTGLSSELAAAIKSGKLSIKEFHNILSDKMSTAFLLKPEEVGEEGKVNRLYERMSEQIQKLSHTLSTIGQEGSPLFQGARQLSSSVDFMNQLNQNFQYVQLPLKFHNESGQGDLYVYTNKRNLANKDGTISALLHLDMEHLGPIDVYVSMTSKEHVSTKLYLKDEKILSFIESKIDLLNERLKNRGYSMKTEAVMSKGEKKEFSQLLIGEGQSSQTLLSTQSFDVRA